ncbi:hypothetical protein DCAR_0207640 [Daucus carota subsp. sativus]|uniref:Uncharacterized protein n=1 Tax=Daucus carota subsp. sativus TaxID=79200 RepID=A0AAF0WHV9_DAUCS|nr:hypothetical protein DCAR_0207640 [Daucus carota subsp. sativus]
MKDGHNKVYKSFSDVIEDKDRKFRETLLDKQVEFSGRSVIVVGHSLSLFQWLLVVGELDLLQFFVSFLQLF